MWGDFEVPSTGKADPILFALVAIADVEGRLLVAVPHKVTRCGTEQDKAAFCPLQPYPKLLLLRCPLKPERPLWILARRRFGLDLWHLSLRGASTSRPVEESTLDYPFSPCRPDEPFLILLLLDLLMAQPLSRRVPVLEKNLTEIATDLKKLSPSSPSTFCFEGRIGEECSCNSKAFTCYGAGCVGLARLASQRARFPR